METVSIPEEQLCRPELEAEFVKVAVYTTAGAYPSKGHERVKVTETVGDILSKAGSTLKLTDTSNWGGPLWMDARSTRRRVMRQMN